MKKIFNSKSLLEHRKNLRNNMTEPEKKLWFFLRGKQFFGYKFRRQESFGEFIVDFYCKELKLVIEIDGDSHYLNNYDLYDKQRDCYLENLKLKVLRFTNDQVMKNIEGVLNSIKTQTTPSPSLERRGDNELL